jgi:hypothetical protein
MFSYRCIPVVRFGVFVLLALAAYGVMEQRATAALLNGSFEDALANPYAGDTIPGWQVSGNLPWSCIAQITGAYPCGDFAETDTEFPATTAAGPRAFRNGSNGDFPRDPNNPDNETNSIYEATWADIVALNYNYISQNVSTTLGNSYLLQFQLQALFAQQPYYGFWVVINQTPVANLSARTQANPVLRTDTANQWATFVIPFVASGPVTEIGFASFVECNALGCDMDLYLDDVSLQDLGGAEGVPEPGTSQLLAVGLPLLGWLAARRRGRQ